MADRAIGVGVIGMGFMGWRHAEAYAAAAAAGLPCRIVAVCDPDPDRRARPASTGNIASAGAGPLDAAGYDKADDLLADPRVGLVSVCTTTDLHVDLALRALERGRHVLVEKPVALTAARLRPLAAAARSAPTLCMPAHCMRFWPGWDWLRARIADRSFGAVRRALFHRSGVAPTWSREFYGDLARSGGALGDFHIHDADFIHWCFGPPRRVRCEGGPLHPRAEYDFGPDGPEVSAEAEWHDRPEAPFRMEYTVEFERARAEFRLGREPLVTIDDGAGPRPVPIEAGSGYDGEVRHLVGAIAAGTDSLRVTMDDALRVAELLDAERACLGSGRWIDLA